MKNYPIKQVCADVADGLAQGNDHSPTTIRCAINDVLDSLRRDGYTVRPDYSQPRAVATVRRMLGVAR